MIAAILFSLSVVAFGQFALYYWRASIAAASTGKVSDHVRVATGISAASISSRDFRAIVIIHELTPDLSGPGRGFRTIRAYYSIVEKIGRLIPLLNDWAEAEMAMCSRYAAVLVGQHLERNMDCMAQLRGT